MLSLKFTYGYDALSRITSWGQKQDSGAGAPTPHTMRYDAASRLSQVLKQNSNGTGTQWNWRFDKAGNRINQQIENFTATATSVERESYTIHPKLDQVTATVSGGPLHVSGTLDEQGKIVPAGGTTDQPADRGRRGGAGRVDRRRPGAGREIDGRRG